jgi:hypothetical protein
MMPQIRLGNKRIGTRKLKVIRLRACGWITYCSAALQGMKRVARTASIILG